MKTITVSASSSDNSTPEFPDGYYLCKDNCGFYVASRNKDTWSYVHSKGNTGGVIGAHNMVCRMIEREVVSRLNFTP